MSYQFDATDNWEYWDNPETATIAIPVVGSTPVSIADVTVKREQTDRSAPEAGGVAITTDVEVWLVPAVLLVSGLTTYEMLPQSTITVGSEVWTVQSASVARVGGSISHYRCVCNKGR